MRATLSIAILLFACQPEQAGKGVALKEGLAKAEAARRPPPLVKAALDTPAELLAVLGRRFSQTVGEVAPLSLEVDYRYELLVAGEPQVRLDGTLKLRMDAKGQFELVDRSRHATFEEPEREEGRSCHWVGGRLYTARRFGPATELKVRAYEQDACLDSAVEPVVGMLRLYADRLDLSPSGEAQVLGRAAQKVVFLLRDVEEVTANLPLAYKGERSPAIWGPRDLLVKTFGGLQRFKGHLLLDAATGAVVGAELAAVVAFLKKEQPAELQVDVKLSSAAFEGALLAPEEARPFQPRQRLFADRQALLGQTFKGKRAKKRRIEALPKPGDAPPLRMGAEVDEDRPTPRDEDRP